MQFLYKYKPVQFFLLTFLGTWIPWYIAAYFSYQKGTEAFQLLLFLFGMVSPFISALFMIYSSKNKELVEDFWDRVRFYKIKVRFLPIILLLMPGVLFLATALSLLFGQPIDQFSLVHTYRVVEGQSMLSLFIIFLAPLMEELGWRGYGVDSLRSNFNLFKTSMVFAVLWALWHLPLFFIKGYYQNELWNTSLIYVINFFVSILPATILLNWVYYKNRRSIMAAFILHLMFNLSSVLFQTEQFTKCLITILLLIISSIVIIRDRSFFFHKNENWKAYTHRT
jgi:membrane protease YdiL (CAAX protease family)